MSFKEIEHDYTGPPSPSTAMTPTCEDNTPTTNQSLRQTVESANQTTEHTVDVQVSNTSHTSTSTSISYNVDRQSYQQQQHYQKYDDSTPLLNRQARGTTPIPAASQGKK